MNILLRILRPFRHPLRLSVGLLAVRVAAGLGFMFHGSGKIQNPFGWMGAEAGTPGVLQALAALSEFGGGFFWILGFLTPIACLGLIGTMSVAVWTHAVVLGDPFVANGGGGSYELATVYLCIAVLLLLAGPGTFSLDRLLFGRKPAGEPVAAGA